LKEKNEIYNFCLSKQKLFKKIELLNQAIKRCDLIYSMLNRPLLSGKNQFIEDIKNTP